MDQGKKTIILDKISAQDLLRRASIIGEILTKRIGLIQIANEFYPPAFQLKALQISFIRCPINHHRVSAIVRNLSLSNLLF
jgi:hypothetical protein